MYSFNFQLEYGNLMVETLLYKQVWRMQTIIFNYQRWLGSNIGAFIAMLDWHLKSSKLFLPNLELLHDGKFFLLSVFSNYLFPVLKNMRITWLKGIVPKRRLNAYISSVTIRKIWFLEIFNDIGMVLVLFEMEVSCSVRPDLLLHSTNDKGAVSFTNYPTYIIQPILMSVISVLIFIKIILHYLQEF